MAFLGNREDASHEIALFALAEDAPGPEAVLYLAGKGVRCVATDGPTLGGVEPKRALWTYWALGGKGMVGVEFLTNVGNLPEGAYFLFAAIKIKGCHGGPGRAIGFY